MRLCHAVLRLGMHTGTAVRPPIACIAVRMPWGDWQELEVGRKVGAFSLPDSAEQLYGAEDADAFDGQYDEYDEEEELERCGPWGPH